jgi:hypothetical protein
MSAIITKTETAKQLTSASTTMRELGICTTCNHVSTCLFSQAARNPVWFCDEFDASNASASAGKPAAVPVAKPADRYFGEAIRVGLCANCDARPGCNYRRPGVTVSECENYQ